MALLDRLAGFGDRETVGKLAVLTFHAMLQELANGVVTQQQIVSYLNLDAGEQTELQFIIDAYNGQPDATAKEKFIETIRTIFILAEGNVPGYTTNAQIVARINAI